jgi:plastocyanin
MRQRKRRAIACVAGILPAALTAMLAWSMAVAIASSPAAVSLVDAGTSGCASAHCYVPAATNITSDTQVTWTNTSTVGHTVTRCTPADCAGQDGGTGNDNGFGGKEHIAPGLSYQFTFADPGTYFYFCRVHGYSVMHGEVIVTAATPPPTPTPQATPTPATPPAPSPSATASITPTASASPSATASPAAAAAGTQNSGGGFPWVPFLVLLLLAAGAGGGAFWLYRRAG